MNTSDSILDKTDSSYTTTDGNEYETILQTNLTSQWECLQGGGSIELCSLGSPVQLGDNGATTHSSSEDNTPFVFDYPDGALQRESSSSSSKELDKGLLT